MTRDEIGSYLGLTLSVIFSNQSTGQVTSWLWDFGDGTTARGRSATHTFGPGSFQVSLHGITSDGCRAEDSVQEVFAAVWRSVAGA